jgi:methionyl-tRNA formyltransferase
MRTPAAEKKNNKRANIMSEINPTRKPSFVFFGTPEVSARFLTILLENGFIPKAVVTNPDKPVGRKKIITPPPVKVVAEMKAIPVLQPTKLDASFQETLRALDADFFVVFAYNKIFRADVLSIPRGVGPARGVIGVHPSFLPEYRGPSPFQTAILDGKTETGVTLYFLDEGIDSGPVLATSDPVAINDNDTYATLGEKLAVAGGALFVKNFGDIATGKIAPEPQDESRATYTKKFKTEDAFISAAEMGSGTFLPDSEKKVPDPISILRKINAFNPEPGAWTIRDDGKRVKLLKAKIADDGTLKPLVTQVEGEKPKTVR